ncbi:hypothetical protein FLL45_04040 [Aliikangiella marina]|uniref:DUF7931 domain-containing protein n=1 Tax=Aliikangiella marina TaxID=1712262 RepID=A0A545TIS8_9GAMM|nr:hypothetical protein [Aliikangiella marina]TQV77129.1 hypothetical protein FLL45_04040 [Aliikangiella marina]
MTSEEKNISQQNSDSDSISGSGSNSNRTSDQLETLELENSTAHFQIKTLKELIEQTKTAFRCAKQKVQIYSPNLDPRVLSNRDIEQVLTRFVRSSRYARVEILITEERKLQGIDHRLVSLAQNFSSYVQIRLIPKDYHENYFAFYLVDGRSIIYRSNFERFESECHEVPSTLIKQRAKYFDEIWQQSSPASHLRALHL